MDEIISVCTKAGYFVLEGMDEGAITMSSVWGGDVDHHYDMADPDFMDHLLDHIQSYGGGMFGG